MTLENKQQEFHLMENSIKRDLQVQIPGGPLLFCRNCWDYKTNLTETSFKTIYDVDKEHPLLVKEALDIKPAFGKTIWVITVLRKPKSNLTDEARKGKGPRPARMR